MHDDYQCAHSFSINEKKVQFTGKAMSVRKAGVWVTSLPVVMHEQVMNMYLRMGLRIKAQFSKSGNCIPQSKCITTHAIHECVV